jgi:ketosteroid isomerase-like protein
MRTRGASRLFEASLRREPRRQLALTTIRSERFGDALYDAGTWTNTVTAADGSERSARGYYLGVYRREHGSWKVVATTFNLAM